MGTKLKTVSVRLNDEAGARVSKAAQLARQSKGAFLARAGEQAADQLLLEWAAQRYRAGEASLSELAYETGIPLEAIAQYLGDEGGEEATRMFLASARRIAEAVGDPGFYIDAKRGTKGGAEDTVTRGRRARKK